MSRCCRNGRLPAEKLPEILETFQAPTAKQNETLLKHGFEYKNYTASHITKQALYKIMATTKAICLWMAVVLLVKTDMVL
jgi:hypothetical protein